MNRRGHLSPLPFWVLLIGLVSAVPGVEARPVEAVPQPGAKTTPQEPLEEEALRFARAWVDGDLGQLESMLAPEGARLHLQGELYAEVDPRRAVAALRGFLGKYAGGEVEVMRTSRSAGESTRGFAELQWRTQIEGTGESAVFTLFVGFALEEEGWRVTEIRILP
jgi:hypothetical protein